MLVVAVPSRTQVVLGLQVLFAEAEGTCHCGYTTRISGYPIIPGQHGHTPGFLPPAKQRKSLSKR